METVILNVNGMHCKSCEILLKEELEDLEGVFSALPDNNKSEVILKFDGTNETLDLVRDTIRKEGYEL